MRYIIALLFALLLIPATANAAVTNGTTVNTYTQIHENTTGIDTAIGGIGGASFGWSVAGIGDINDDGVTDLAVSALTASPQSVFVFLMNADGTVDSFQQLDAATLGFVADTDFGDAVAGIGDLDDDGIPDIAVGAGSNDSGGANRGAVHILFMNNDGTVSATSTISASSTALTGVLDNGDFFGTDLDDLGDLDGDGNVDLLVGARGDDDGGSARGAAYILFLSPTGTLSSYAKVSASTTGFTTPLGDSDNFGDGLANIGDVDGDGVTDIAVGAQFDDDGTADDGAVYIIFMNTDGSIDGFQKISQTEGGFVRTDNTGFPLFGTDIAGLGDYDGDGVPDIAVGADQDNDNGSVFVLLLNDDGTVKDSNRIYDGTPGFQDARDLDDIGAGNFGISLDAVADFNGDGILELAIGEYEFNPPGGDDYLGGVHILFFAPSSISSSVATVPVSEGSTPGTVDITLNSEPLSQVDIVLAFEGTDATADLDGICFTSTSTDTGSGLYAPCSAWNSAQTLTITATDDSEVEGSHTDSLLLTASSSDDSYNGATSTISITITDAAAEEAPEEEAAGSGGGYGVYVAPPAAPTVTNPSVPILTLSNLTLPTLPAEWPSDPVEREKMVREIQVRIVTVLQEVVKLLLQQIAALQGV